MAAFAGNSATTGDLAQDVTNLAEAGYIDASDFRSAYPPEAVEIGLAAVRQARRVCR